MVSDLKLHLEIINMCFERNGLKFVSIHGNVNTTHNMVCSFLGDSLTDEHQSFKYEHQFSPTFETVMANQQKRGAAYYLRTTEQEINSFVEVKKQVEGLLGDAGDIIKSFLMDFATINIDFNDLNNIMVNLYDGVRPSLMIKFSEFDFFKLDIKRVIHSSRLEDQARSRKNRLKPFEPTEQQPT